MEIQNEVSPVSAEGKSLIVNQFKRSKIITVMGLLATLAALISPSQGSFKEELVAYHPLAILLFFTAIALYFVVFTKNRIIYKICSYLLILSFAIFVIRFLFFISLFTYIISTWHW